MGTIEHPRLSASMHTWPEDAVWTNPHNGVLTVQTNTKRFEFFDASEHPTLSVNKHGEWTAPRYICGAATGSTPCQNPACLCELHEV